MNWYILPAVLLAALVPVSLLVTRHELRKVRLRVVQELQTTLFRDQKLPQLELIAAKYRADTDASGKTRQSLVLVEAGAFIFFAVSLAGFLLLLVPRVWLLSETPEFPRITHALLWSIAPGPSVDSLATPVTVAAVAFLGGFVFQLRYLIRATINQELSALAFVRATLQILQGVIVALVAFRVMGATLGDIGAGVADGGSGDGGSGGFAAALGIAFIFGLFPNIGLMRLAKFVRVHTKAIDKDAIAAAKLIPLEVIDGIDAETAFRLEESNLFDVQNLATINPIGLYAETPFSLLGIFDWVLQAQLCANVGPDAFKVLRQHKVRTIFDLERAVLAEGAPPAYVRAIGAILFETGLATFRTRMALPASPADQPAQGIDIDVETVRHAVAIMVDDLHVHRLRALWRIMLHTTAGIADAQSPWLYQTGPLPGDRR